MKRLLAILLRTTLLLVMLTPALAGAQAQHVRIETSAGNFTVRVEPERAPLTVRNFLQYAQEDFYAGTVFHRVVNGFVIQGGGYDRNFVLKPTRPTIPNESGNGLANRRGSIAMARTGDPHSADSQFYINLADNVALDPKPTRWGYAVFGEVVEGMEVVDEIGHRATAAKGGMQDVPVEPVIIKKVVVLSGAAR